MIARCYAVFLVLIGIGVLAGGLALAGYGGSIYYVIAGLAMASSGVLIWHGDRRGAWLYGAMLVGTLAWAIYNEVQPNTSQILEEQTVNTLNPFLLLVMLAVSPGSASAADAGGNSQTVVRAGSQPSAKGSTDYFTGNVRVDPLFPANDSTPVSGGSVTFEAGARSAWHTHPAGQHLIVTAGVGWTQQWSGSIVEVRAGDVIWCPPGVKHWHGATPTTAMTHIAITGVRNGKNVEWMEKVSDEQYRR